VVEIFSCKILYNRAAFVILCKNQKEIEVEMIVFLMKILV